MADQKPQSDPGKATTQSPQPQTDPPKENKPDQDAKTRRPGAARRNMIRWSMALIGFVVGAVSGTYLEELLARANPGFFGPDNQQVIEDQHENFAALEAKLAELKLTASDDPSAGALINELGLLIQEQKNLSEKKDELFKETDIQQQALKAELMRDRGVSGAVDFWIRPGESMILRDPDKALSVLRYWTNADNIDVNLSGEVTRINVGDTLPVKTSQGDFTLIYRHGKRESDGRYGFDLAGPK